MRQLYSQSAKNTLPYFLHKEIYTVAFEQAAKVAPPSLAAARLPNISEWLVGVANVPTKIIFKKRLTWAFQNIRPSLSMTRN